MTPKKQSSRRSPKGKPARATGSRPKRPAEAAYVPSEAALVLARIFDGAARPLWPAPAADDPSGVTDEELSRARGLLAVVHYAFQPGSPERRGRFKAADDLLRGRPTTERERLLGYVDHVTALVTRFRDGERDDTTRGASAPLIIYGLSAGFDPLFAALSPDGVAEALRGVVSLPKGKGGAGNVGAEHVAAELAVEVNAFGAARTGDFDRDVAAFKSRLRTERSRAWAAISRKTSQDE